MSRMGRLRHFLVAVFLALPSSPQVVAGQWSTLGCFPVSVIPKQQIVTPAKPQKPGLSTCSSICGKNAGVNATPYSSFPYPLFAFTDKVCYCGAILPKAASGVVYNKCAKTGFLYLYMINNVPKQSSCRILNYWKKDVSVAYGSDKLTWSKDKATVTINMKGTNGARLYTTDHYLYGIHSATIKASSTPGAVTTLYLTDDVNEQHTCQHEVDIEIINAVPCKEGNCLWFNTFTNGYGNGGNNFKFNGSAVKSITKKNFSVGDSHDYLVWWQPNFICWYVDGVRIHCNYQRKAPYQIPYYPQRLTVSMWSNCNDWQPEFKGYWGGCIKDWKKVTTSTVSNLARVACTKPVKSRYDRKRKECKKH